jgi:hypothetical protein
MVFGHTLVKDPKSLNGYVCSKGCPVVYVIKRDYSEPKKRTYFKRVK